MNSKKGSVALVVLVLILVVVVGVGIYAYNKYRISYEESSASACAAGKFCSGSTTPESVLPGGTYTAVCNYGYVGNGITVVPGSGSCSYKSFNGKTAEFDCVAGKTAGTFNNSCKLDSGSPYPQRTDSIGTITVANPAAAVSGVAALIPANATEVTNIQAIPNAVGSGAGWHWNWDPGTVSSNIAPVANSTLVDNGAERMYTTTFHANGQGEIFKITWGNNPNVTHFIYDTDVEFTNPSSVMNLEMDMNQVLSNGDTMIYGVQCAGGNNGTWMDTVISPVNGVTKSHWQNSAIPCDPATWTPNTWYHIQIATHRDNSGDIFYDWVAVNGKICYFGNGCVAPSAGKSVEGTNEERPLGWGAGTLLDNFQLDGQGSNGSMTAYTKDFTMWYW